MSDYTSRYGDDDEIYDPDAYIQEIIDRLRRDAEGLKLDGKYSQMSLLLLSASNALQDLHARNEELLDKLIMIEDLVSRALKDQR